MQWWYFAILGNIKSKLYKPELPKVIKKPPENLWHIQFSIKEVEFVNLPSIFNNINVTSSINSSINFPTPIVV